ncbi:hypothetical protein ACFO5R_18915 [Halosolutus amylolyticus]|uniref:ABC-2 type transport system permease protein n=1 Tax=Halosolutus amylolyticus TaxID=2932267 RepID=A0ABD5PVJ6_9EURY|nr:hypothetical protein [Halosolutus amylolyticus]
MYETLWSEPGAYSYGTRLSTASDREVLETVRGMAGVVFLITTYFVTFKMISNGEHLERESEAILSAATPRTLAVSDMLTLTAYSIRLLGAPVLIGAVSFGLGSGSVFPMIAVIAASSILVLTVVALVYPSILAARLLTDTVLQTRRKRSFVTVPLVLLMFVMFLEFRQSISLLSTMPIGWYADIALLAHLDEASITNALLALFSGPVAAGLSLLVVGRIGNRLWLTDRVQRSDPTLSNRRRFRGARGLERIISCPVFAAVLMNWMRISRQPRVFLYGGLVVVLTGGAGITAVREFPASAPLIVAIYGAVAVGVGATLNPLGNEGPALTAALTTRRGGEILLTGYALSAAIPGGLLVGIATLGTAVTVGTSLLTQSLLTVLGGVLGFLSPFISIGIGTALPKFSGTDPTDSAAVEIPRLEAVLVFLFSLVVIGVPAAFGLYDAGTRGELSFALLAGPIATVLLGSAIGWASFRYGVAAIGDLEITS